MTPMIDLFIRIHKLINFYTGLIYYIVDLNEDYVQRVGYSGNLGTFSRTHFFKDVLKAHIEDIPRMSRGRRFHTLAPL